MMFHLIKGYIISLWNQSPTLMIARGAIMSNIMHGTPISYGVMFWKVDAYGFFVDLERCAIGEFVTLKSPS